VVRTLVGTRWRPVYAAFTAAAVLHVAWAWLLAGTGGDLAAQDAWAAFARLHPRSAYDLAWYGGMHPVSYSAMSPYVMAAFGVRTTMVVAGTASAALLASMLARTRVLQRPLWPALYGAVALVGDAVSGRATFALGSMFGLGAVAVVVTWSAQPHSRRLRVARAVLIGLLSTLATAASPVAGLFVGLVAVALWLGGRRREGVAMGLPPAVVVALSAWLFPFEGRQPMHATSVILPVLIGIACLCLTPRSWRTVRIASGLYVAAVLASWAVPSPVGSNVTRLGLLFGGVLLVAAASNWPSNRLSTRSRLVDRLGASKGTAFGALVVAITVSSVWQVSAAADDAIRTRPTYPGSWSTGPLVEQLRMREADLGRVEAVPTRSHREATALAPYFNLARGWNRQADAERNPIFYQDGLLTEASYREWLDRWAVRFVVVSSDPPDDAATAEADAVAAGLPYLRRVWSDARWTLYQLLDPVPLADPPAVVTHFDAAGVELWVPRSATVKVRIPSSPWLTLVDDQGVPIRDPAAGCLSALTTESVQAESTQRWTELNAPGAGTYRIAAPYTLPRGTPCPHD
jgi:hypothetical protein